MWNQGHFTPYGLYEVWVFIIHYHKWLNRELKCSKQWDQRWSEGQFLSQAFKLHMHLVCEILEYLFKIANGGCWGDCLHFHHVTTFVAGMKSSCFKTRVRWESLKRYTQLTNFAKPVVGAGLQVLFGSKLTHPLICVGHEYALRMQKVSG